MLTDKEIQQSRSQTSLEKKQAKQKKQENGEN